MIGKHVTETTMSWRNYPYSIKYETLSNEKFLIRKKGKGEKKKNNKS